MHPLLVNALETFKILIKGRGPEYDGTSTLTTENQNKPLTDDEYVADREGDTEISTYQEVAGDAQLNGEPHTRAAEPMKQLNNGSPNMDLTEGEQAYIDLQRGFSPSDLSATHEGPSISDGQGRLGLPVEDHLNKITVSSVKKDLTIEELRLSYPNAATHLTHYGVLTVDKKAFEAFYKECTRKAMLLQKPISEIIKDA